MRTPRIAVVGSYATGLTMKVKRLPATGETVLGSGYRVDYGGKGSNQAVGCARLGAQVAFVARIGKDPFGEMALRLYREEGIDSAFIQQTAGRPTESGSSWLKPIREITASRLILEPTNSCRPKTSPVVTLLWNLQKSSLLNLKSVWAQLRRLFPEPGSGVK